LSEEDACTVTADISPDGGGGTRGRGVRFDAIVVGSGIGALAFAGLMARWRQWRVDIRAAQEGGRSAAAK